MKKVLIFTATDPCFIASFQAGVITWCYRDGCFRAFKVHVKGERLSAALSKAA